jgi:hypothetical protein
MIVLKSLFLILGLGAPFKTKVLTVGNEKTPMYRLYDFMFPVLTG